MKMTFGSDRFDSHSGGKLRIVLPQNDKKWAYKWACNSTQHKQPSLRVDGSGEPGGVEWGLSQKPHDVRKPRDLMPLLFNYIIYYETEDDNGYHEVLLFHSDPWQTSRC